MLIKKIAFQLSFLLVIISSPCKAQQIMFADSAELFMPGLVSTKNADVKITFSPDGNKMLWGGIDWITDKKDMDIWMSDLIDGKWTTPQPARFNSDSNDFDPFFSPDGKGIYFFSNRKGGFGGDDIYFTPYDLSSDTFSEPVNVGAMINTAGNEWAPITDDSGKHFFFSSSGHGGYGGQDLFISDILQGKFGKPVNLGASINSADDNFDAVTLPGGNLVFTSSRGKDKKADLYYSMKKGFLFTTPVKLPAQINATEFWTFGPSVTQKKIGYLYFSSHLSTGMGRTDIYRIKYYFK
jgi:TolB protein